MSPIDLPVTLSRQQKMFLMEAGLILRDSQRYAAAEAVFEGALSLVHDKHLALVGIGSTRFAQGDWEGAIGTFEEAARARPDAAIAYAHLGEALAFGGHIEEARLALAKASGLDPSGESGGEMARAIERLLSYGII
jgi:tetratricopeptide (TPR) repeat protein